VGQQLNEALVCVVTAIGAAKRQLACRQAPRGEEKELANTQGRGPGPGRPNTCSQALHSISIKAEWVAFHGLSHPGGGAPEAPAPHSCCPFHSA
jgi:hypothetical protein